mmetsp:Transcript_9670/g.21573  ORF Transcript_9670/g.21573 Transcript_9670/m.21573 type:complete len:559 (+) Transcript_9670:92-1768(+)
MVFDLISKLLFPAPPASYGVDDFPQELIWVPRSLDPRTSGPEDCVPCLFLPYSSARYLIFYLHSNGEDIGRCVQFCRSLRAQFQVHVFVVEYPGYGICPGGPCDEQRVTENAFAAFRFVYEVMQWPLDSIIVLGRSIGCGPAVSLAVEYQVSGLILVSPMLSVKTLMHDLLGPLAYVVDERFPNWERVQRVVSPLLVVHGQKDFIIPFRHGVEIYNACKGRKLLVNPKDMGHNTNLLSDVTYLILPMLQFFSLPDYCFEDIHVPQWAYDKRLSPFYREPWASARSEESTAKPSLLGDLPMTARCPMCPALPSRSEFDVLTTQAGWDSAVPSGKRGEKDPTMSLDGFVREESAPGPHLNRTHRPEPIPLPQVHPTKMRMTASSPAAPELAAATPPPPCAAEEDVDFESSEELQEALAPQPFKANATELQGRTNGFHKEPGSNWGRDVARCLTPRLQQVASQRERGATSPLPVEPSVDQWASAFVPEVDSDHSLDPEDSSLRECAAKNGHARHKAAPPDFPAESNPAMREVIGNEKNHLVPLGNSRRRVGSRRDFRESSF